MTSPPRCWQLAAEEVPHASLAHGHLAEEVHRVDRSDAGKPAVPSL